VELRNSCRIIDLCKKYSTLGAARNQAGIGLWIAVVDILYSCRVSLAREEVPYRFAALIRPQKTSPER
jgi:hypothetical protein